MAQAKKATPTMMDGWVAQAKKEGGVTPQLFDKIYKFNRAAGKSKKKAMGATVTDLTNVSKKAKVKFYVKDLGDGLFVPSAQWDKWVDEAVKNGGTAPAATKKKMNDYRIKYYSGKPSKAQQDKLISGAEKAAKARIKKAKPKKAAPGYGEIDAKWAAKQASDLDRNYWEDLYNAGKYGELEGAVRDFLKAQGYPLASMKDVEKVAGAVLGMGISLAKKKPAKKKAKPKEKPAKKKKVPMAPLKGLAESVPVMDRNHWEGLYEKGEWDSLAKEAGKYLKSYGVEATDKNVLAFLKFALGHSIDPYVVEYEAGAAGKKKAGGKGPVIGGERYGKYRLKAVAEKPVTTPMKLKPGEEPGKAPGKKKGAKKAPVAGLPAEYEAQFGEFTMMISGVDRLGVHLVQKSTLQFLKNPEKEVTGIFKKKKGEKGLDGAKGRAEAVAAAFNSSFGQYGYEAVVTKTKEGYLLTRRKKYTYSWMKDQYAVFQEEKKAWTQYSQGKNVPEDLADAGNASLTRMYEAREEMLAHMEKAKAGAKGKQLAALEKIEKDLVLDRVSEKEVVTVMAGMFEDMSPKDLWNEYENWTVEEMPPETAPPAGEPFVSPAFAPPGWKPGQKMEAGAEEQLEGMLSGGVLNLALDMLSGEADGVLALKSEEKAKKVGKVMGDIVVVVGKYVVGGKLFMTLNTLIEDGAPEAHIEKVKAVIPKVAEMPPGLRGLPVDEVRGYVAEMQIAMAYAYADYLRDQYIELGMDEEADDWNTEWSATITAAQTDFGKGKHMYSGVIDTASGLTESAKVKLAELSEQYPEIAEGMEAAVGERYSKFLKNNYPEAVEFLGS